MISICSQIIIRLQAYFITSNSKIDLWQFIFWKRRTSSWHHWKFQAKYGEVRLYFQHMGTIQHCFPVRAQSGLFRLSVVSTAKSCHKFLEYYCQVYMYCSLKNEDIHSRRWKTRSLVQVTLPQASIKFLVLLFGSEGPCCLFFSSSSHSKYLQFPCI